MKQLISLITGIFCLLSLSALTSCDDDTIRSMHLSGRWDGRFGMYYDYDYYDQYYRRWFTASVDAYNSELEFLPDYDYATHGYGHEFDYYDRGPYEYQYFYFHWEIRNGVIYIEYPHNHHLDTELYDYSISDLYLKGRFSSGTRFSLRKFESYYDWSPWYQYDTDYYDYYYRYERLNWKPEAPTVLLDDDDDVAIDATRSESALADTPESPQVRNVRLGRRY